MGKAVTSGYASAEIDRQPVIISYVKGNVTDWKYVSITEAKEFWNQTNLMTILTASDLVFSLIIGLLCAFLLVKHNYRTLERIMLLMQQ